VPITTPISPSYSIWSDTEGMQIGSPSPMSDEEGLKKSSGSAGTSLPSSRACAA
jgi:hypothetical protein